MKPRRHKEQIWLALMVGNSRLHWAWFIGEQLQTAWDTPHLPATVVQQLANCRNLDDLPAEILPLNQTNPKSKIQNPKSILPLYLASVVPSQTALWQTYPNVHLITLDQVPLKNLYPTLGIDRALGLWGAGETWGFPMLIIDAGTALTFTGADANRRLVGGAILPGVRLQLQSLAQRTADLPPVEITDTTPLPSRWALNTPKAIQSGVIYSIVAGISNFIQAWWQEFPESCIALTGGDRSLLLSYLQSQYPQIADKVVVERNLIFWGMQSYWATQSRG